MQLDHSAYRLGIFGASGTGKTSFALRFLANTPATCRFIFDAEDGELSQRLGLTPCTTPDELDAAVSTGWVCFDPWGMFTDGEPAIRFFSTWAFEVSERLPGRKFFVVDELQGFCSGHKVPDELAALVRRGRRRGLDSVFLSHSPGELHNSIRAQLTEVVCFLMTDPLALEWPAAFGFDPEEIRSLEPYRFVARTKWGAMERG
jgi:hypothetical protein